MKSCTECIHMIEYVKIDNKDIKIMTCSGGGRNGTYCE